jgi:hypothetical protein
MHATETNRRPRPPLVDSARPTFPGENMSLVTVLLDRRFRDLINPLVLRLARLSGAAFAVRHPRTGNAAIVGTAFDYMVRFELQRSAADTVDGRWIAEEAVLRFAEEARTKADVKLLKACDRVVSAARRHHEKFVRSPPPAHTAVMIQHSVRLAGLDLMYRSGYRPDSLSTLDLASCYDVGTLLRRVPWTTLTALGPIRLNPKFGKWSSHIGGADADLIAGTTLIELKTEAKIQPRRCLQQLVGYALLASAADEDAQMVEKFALDAVGIYYARCEAFVRLSLEPVFAHRQFREIRDEFLDKARRATDGDSLTHWRTQPVQLSFSF